MEIDKSNTPPRFFKFQKWYQMAQNNTNDVENDIKIHEPTKATLCRCSSK